jgi:hypothetical protein
MPKNQSISQDRKIILQPNPRFIGSLVIGAFVAVFIGLLAMAVAILIVGIMRLFLPDLTFRFAGISITAVTFVIFCALGWIGATIIIWHKLSPE